MRSREARKAEREQILGVRSEFSFGHVNSEYPQNDQLRCLKGLSKEP